MVTRFESLTVEQRGLSDFLAEIASRIPHIDAERQYWFVRTSGGRFFKTFVGKDLIAIGYDEVRLRDIFNKEGTEYQRIKKAVQQAYPNKKIGLSVSQLHRFIYEMKYGDIVIIPSERSEHLAFGVILDDGPAEVERVDPKCSYNKIRHVQWHKSVSRRKLHPNLGRVFYTHQTICNAEKYADWIDAELNDIYFKNEKLNMVLRVAQQRDIHARALYPAMANLIDLSESFLREGLSPDLYEQLEEELNSLATKISLNSEGAMKLIGKGFQVVCIIGILTIFLGGGTFKVKAGETKFTPLVDTDISSSGVLKPIFDFINSREENKMKASVIQKALKELKIQNPEELKDAVKALAPPANSGDST